MAFKILVADAIASEGIERLQSEADLIVDVKTSLSESELIRTIPEYDALIVRSGSHVTKDVIAAGARLKVIGRAGVGVDNIDVTAATKRGILVLNTPEGNTVSTAEHTIALLLAVARSIPQAHLSLARDRVWDRKTFLGAQVSGKVLGVLGLGRVGMEVARRGLGLGMKVLGYDPFISAERAERLGIQTGDVDQICAQADFLTVHTPLTKATEGLVGEKQFSLMKPTARIINCARGGIIDEGALLEALNAGKIAGAALDVFVEEPPLQSPLLEHPKVIVTPHLAASTYEAQVSVSVDVATHVIQALRGKPVRTAVNAPYPSGDRPEIVSAYMQLCESLGRFYTEVIGGSHDRIEVEYSGDVAKLDPDPLTTAVLKGILSPVLFEHVNLVNARVFAGERGIRLTETRKESNGDYSGMIVLRRADGERMVAGALTGKHVPTLVMIDGYKVSVSGEGRLLVAFNEDRPGTIGKVGMLLGEYGINIAFMQVGRKTVGSYAVMVLGIDNEVPDELMEKLHQMEELRDVRLMEW